MIVDVFLYAGLRSKAPRRRHGEPVRLELSHGSACRDVLTALDVPPKMATIIMVNGVRRELDWELQEGDRVGLFPPIGGG